MTLCFRSVATEDTQYRLGLVTIHGLGPEKRLLDHAPKGTRERTRFESAQAILSSRVRAELDLSPCILEVHRPRYAHMG